MLPSLPVSITIPVLHFPSSFPPSILTYPTNALLVSIFLSISLFSFHQFPLSFLYISFHPLFFIVGGVSLAPVLSFLLSSEPRWPHGSFQITQSSLPIHLPFLSQGNLINTHYSFSSPLHTPLENWTINLLEEEQRHLKGRGVLEVSCRPKPSSLLH